MGRGLRDRTEGEGEGECQYFVSMILDPFLGALGAEGQGQAAMEAKGEKPRLRSLPTTMLSTLPTPDSALRTSYVTPIGRAVRRIPQ